MKQHLDKLCLLSPAISSVWSRPPAESAPSMIRRIDGQDIRIDLPLFWYAPPWHRFGVSSADAIAVAAGQLGVMVSALRSDLSDADQQPAFHSPQQADDEEAPDADASPLPRIVPYRPERYGLCDQDFDESRVVDVRLSLARDESGRFAYSAQQLQRWETTPANDPLAGGSWVPAATLPPDVNSLPQLSSKLNQLRALAPQAAVFVSIGPHRLEDELIDVVATRPDGLIIRLDELALDGLQLATITVNARKLIDQQGSPNLPLWLVPGDVTPDDAVKLIALGASAIAIDGWCAPIVDAAESQYEQAAAQRAYASLSRSNDEQLLELVESELVPKVNRFEGLRHSMVCQPSSQRLGCLDQSWSKALGVPALPLACIPES